MPSTVRIASCSIMPTKWDKAANLLKMLTFMEEAVKRETDLIMVPEGCLEGYVVTEATREEREHEMMLLAEDENGPAIEKFREFCRKHSVNALIGFLEKIDDEGYNTALWIDRNGETRGKYHKTHLNEGYQDEWYHNRGGSEIRAFDTDVGRVGVMICFDRRVPEVARCLMLDGARILLNPSYGFFRGSNDSILVARAHENHLPVVFTHPNKTLVVAAGGDIVFLREQEDTVSHVTVPLTEGTSPEENMMRRLRRTELYGKLLER